MLFEGVDNRNCGKKNLMVLYATISIKDAYADKVDPSTHGKSLSKLVGDCFWLLNQAQISQSDELTPIAQSLKGSLGKTQVDESDHQAYLEEKQL